MRQETFKRYEKKYILTEKKLQEINAAIKNQENC